MLSQGKGVVSQDKAGLNALPLSTDTLYWRVYLHCDDYLKRQTTLAWKYHDITARYFANLWRDCFKDKVDANKKKYIFPLPCSLIANHELFAINRYIGQEIRMFLFDQKLLDTNTNIANVQVLEQIANRARQIMLLSKQDELQKPQTVNDNASPAPTVDSVAS